MMDNKDTWKLMNSMRYILNQCTEICVSTVAAYEALIEVQNEAWTVLNALWEIHDHTATDCVSRAEEVPLDTRT